MNRKTLIKLLISLLLLGAGVLIFILHNNEAANVTEPEGPFESAPYEQIKKDTDINTTIESALMVGSNLIIKIKHESREEQPVTLEGDSEYTISNAPLRPGETATVTIYNYTGEYFKIVVGTSSDEFIFGDAPVWIPPYTYSNGVFTEGNKATWGEAAFQRHDGVWLKEKDLNISNGNWPYEVTETVDFYHISRLGESLGRPIPKTGKHKFEPGYIEWSYEIPAASISTVRATFTTKTLKKTDLKQFIWIAPTVRDSNNSWIDLLNDTQLINAVYPLTVLDPWKVNSSGADSTWGAGIYDNSTEDKGSATLVMPAIFADDFDDGNEDLTEHCGSGSVVNGRYKFTGSGGLVCPAYYNFNVTDILLTAIMNATTTSTTGSYFSWAGLMGRWNDSVDYSYNTVYTNQSGGSHGIRILRKDWSSNQWTFSVIASNTTVFGDHNTEYTVIFRLNGTELFYRMFNDSVDYELLGSDSGSSRGKIGFHIQKLTTATFDNFRALELYSTGMPILTTSYQTANRDSGTGNEPKNVTVIFTRKDFQEDLYINGVLIQADISNNTNYAIGAGNGTNYSITINGTAPNSTAYNRVQSITVWEGSSAVGDTTPPTVTIDAPANTTITDNTPDLNITIDETVNVTYSWNGEGNISGCRNCTSYNTTYGENNGSDTDLVAMWHFNENFGAIAYDDTAYGNDGTLGNVTAGTKPTWTTGRFGYGLNFDGENDFVNISYDASLDVLDGNTPFALTMWIKFNVIPSTAGTAYMIFAQNHGTGTGKNWLQVLDGDDKFASPIGPEAYHLSDFVVQNNTWYFLVLGYDGTNLTIWVNGNLELNEASTPDEDATGDYYIGTKRTADGNWFNGTIDEVMLYNRSLSAGEISELYNRTLPEGLHNVTVYANDTAGNANSTKRWFTVSGQDFVAPVLSNVTFWAVDGNKNILGNETAFNSTNLQVIEFMNITFTVTDPAGIFGDITIFFTANGSNACALGNNQSATCYNWTDDTWVEYKNGTSTSTYVDDNAQGDSIDCSYVGNATQRNYTCKFDEQYNPNIYKHYPLNKSDVKWQSAVGFRISKNVIWKYEIDSTIPLDATFFKSDFRANYTQGVLLPTQPLLTYLCNENHTSGHPEGSSDCEFIGSKLPAQFQDDGTHHRVLFEKNLSESLGEPKHYMILSDTPAGKYYSMKTYKYLGSEPTRSSISTDGGLTYTNLSDGYESELNINWFYNASDGDVTQFIFKVQMNDTLGNVANSSEQVMTWQLEALNLIPIIDIIVPQIGANLSGSVYINWTASDPNGDTLITNITANNGTTINISLGNPDANNSYLWDTTALADGNYNLTVETCENTTAELNCANDTHAITIDNTAPQIIINSEQDQTLNRSYYFGNITISETPGTALMDWNGTNYTMSCSGLECTYNRTGLTNGNYTIILFYVNDSAGNMNVTAAFWINISVVAPPGNISIFITYPTNKTYTSIVDIPLWVYYTGNTSAIDTWQYTLDGGNWTTFAPNVTLFNLENTPQPHNLTVKVNTTDGGENQTSIFFTVTYDGLFYEYEIKIKEGEGMIWQIYISLVAVGLGLMLFSMIAIQGRLPVVIPAVSGLFLFISAFYSFNIEQAVGGGITYQYVYAPLAILWGALGLLMFGITLWTATRELPTEE